jgi:alpha,alpha-trehalose phosphorylase
MAVVNGFGGMRDYPDGLRFAPVLPGAWGSYRFNVLYRGSRIEIAVSRDGVDYKLLDGPAVRFTSHGEKVVLTPEAPSRVCGSGDR